MVGVDKIVKETEVNKMTFYNYFHSKERFIDICLIVQKERLQDQVVAIVEYDHETSTIDKLKKTLCITYRLRRSVLLII